MARINGTNHEDDLDGTSSDDVIDALASDDRLWGYEGDDFLMGGSGNDELDGGSGADEMEGGTGDDLYVVDTLDDIVLEFAGGGTFDVVYTTLAAYTLDAQVEDLTFFGTGDFTGTGNNLDNFIHGFDGNDTLDGGLGVDTLYGELGDDAYYLDQVGDRAIEVAGRGYDYVFTSLGSLTLGANIEELIFDGTGNFRGVGNNLDNYLGGGTGNDTLSGRDGNDTLDGGAGADVMNGGAGNDIYVVNGGADRVVELDGGGSDLVRSTASLTLGAHVENLRLFGTSAINGQGNDLRNSIVGNGAANVLNGRGGSDSLSGGLGSDTLYGGLGNDVLTGGTGADRYVFDTTLNRTLNVDRISDFAAGTDEIRLDRLVFTEIAANGTLAADAFVEGGVARDAEDRILYNQSTGQLFYDSDGTGAAAAVLFARVTPGLDLSNTDFSAFI